MKRGPLAALIVLLALGVTGVVVNAQSPRPAAPVPEAAGIDQDAPYREACARQKLTESECIGRLIWFKATAGNERFHTYTFQQRVGVLIDWYRVMRADQRDDRFRAWGIINDPACCRPGDPNCPARTPDETFGFDWCPGDDVLLRYVGKPGYVDPACGLKDVPVDSTDLHSKGGKLDQRQSACDLKFGTSTGALGFRKFPNPRFDAARWKQVNGGNPGTWDGFRKKMNVQTKVPSDERVSKLADASVEPPFLVGTTCGSCHIAFDPANPPADPAHPKWVNIKGLIGNQYTRMSEVLGSGMSRNSLEWQMFANPRPGVTDTSAVSNDQVNNPGTINAIINTSQRPTFAGEKITKWRKVAACGGGADERTCWCEPGRDAKCWQKSTRTDDETPVNVAGQRKVKAGVHHILKGGEDSIGAHEAIQRVYFNIGSCSEACWVNHLTDFRQVDPQQRGFGQTAFDIGQCRRDCPNFRAIEDRLGNIGDFFFSAEADATDLDAARAAERKAKNPKAPEYKRRDLVADLEREFGAGAVKRGRDVFAAKCARCHSSIPESVGGPFANRDFYALDETVARPTRADFLGNDVRTPVTEVGTFRCRALHSNHVPGHLFAEYGSDSMHAQATVRDVPERDGFKDGGRGYYRNISLVNLWATAPFMHNNAIGPELCGKPAHAENDFSRARYVGPDGKPLAQQPACVPFDPTVEGRFRLYKQSMRELLHPNERGAKTTLTDADIILDLGLRSWDGSREKAAFGFDRVTIPRGVHPGFLNGLQHKQLIGDLFLAVKDPARLEAEGKKERVPELQEMAKRLATEPSKFVDLIREKKPFIEKYYQSCTAEIENEGHRFGEDLPEADKNALTAFLATL